MNPQYNFLRPAYWLGRVDSRPLSLFRICFAALLLKNALYLIPLAQLFYSDDGIVPRPQFWDETTSLGDLRFSVLNYLPAAWMSAAFFVLWAAVCLALLLGCQTRWMAVLNYLIKVSLFSRNHFHLTGADHVMTALSFWIIFLPLDQHYTLWQWLGRRRGTATQAAPATAFAFPLRMVQIQVALIYILTSYYKWQGALWRQGDALYYTLQQNGYLLPSGLWLGEHSPLWLLRLLAWSTLLIEAGFALLVFVPILQPWARACGLLLAAALHLGIALLMAIPDFSLVMWISYILFFDPAWMDWLERQVRRWRKRAPPVVPRVDGVLTGAAASEGAPPAPRWRLPPRLGQAGLVLALTPVLLATAWGGLEEGRGLSTRAAPPMPAILQAIDDQLQLASAWRMFIYRTIPNTGWLVVQGQFENGEQRLLYSGADAASGLMHRLWGPPARLRVLEQHLFDTSPSPILRAWGGYYCQTFNRGRVGAEEPADGARLVTATIYRHYRQAHAPGAAPNPYKDELLWTQRCLGG